MPAGDVDTSQRGKRVTIMEVARRAGVSHQTVSRYLRHNGGLKPPTVKKIEAAIRELDYRPDLIARSMRTRHSNRIAIVLPELTYFVPSDLRGASAAAREAGYLIDVVSLEGDARARRDRMLALLDSERVEGILALTPIGDLISSRATPGDAPIHVVGEYDDKMRATGSFADATFAASIIERLADLGHRRFMHVTGSLDWASARNRRDMYLQTIERLGLESYDVSEGDWSVRSGYEAARDLPSNSHVTAVFAANDFVALGVIRGLQDRGIRVPDDVSVVGWDDEEFTRFMSPTMSTVATNKEVQGRRAMESLIAEIQGDPLPADDPESVPKGRLILRGSSGPAPAEPYSTPS